jgi:energy-coupling factor transporter ATP-binding protein EcfA2
MGIATVFQDLALCENLDVVANLFLGHELSPWRLDEVQMEVRAWTLLKELAARIPSVREPVASLSGGQRQTVAIARSLLLDPRIIMLDEPTAALGVAQTAEVLNLIERVRDRGLGVIIISHNMEDVRAVADRIVVLRLGRNNGIFSADISHQDLVAAITGRQREFGVAPAGTPGRRSRGSTGMTNKPTLDRADARVRHDDSLKGALKDFTDRLRSGDLGMLPVIVGLILISTVFSALNPVFLAPNNLVNLLFDCATVGVISLGIVCVLMLGEIDLSVGSMSGLASAMIGVLWVNAGVSLPLAILAALACGALIGAVYAFLFNRLGMPSFVSTLSGLLAILGLQLYILGPTGSINLPFASPLVGFGQLWMPPGLAFLSSRPAAGGRDDLGRPVGDEATPRRRGCPRNRSPAGAEGRRPDRGAGGRDLLPHLGRGVPVMFGLFVLLAVILNYGLTRTNGAARCSPSAATARPRGGRASTSAHLPFGLHALLHACRPWWCPLGLAPCLLQPAGRDRRREPERHRGGGDRRHQPFRRTRQRLVGRARDHRDPGDFQRADAFEPVVIPALHDHRGRACHRRDRRQPGPPVARQPWPRVRRR